MGLENSGRDTIDLQQGLRRVLVVVLRGHGLLMQLIQLQVELAPAGPHRAVIKTIDSIELRLILVD